MVARRIQPAERLLAPAVATTINHLDRADSDAAAVKLAEQYAATIDDATRIAAALGDIEQHLDAEDDDGRTWLYALAKRVDAHTVLADLGPKLLAVLDALGATPAARAKLKGGAQAGGPSGLTKLRGTRSA